MVGADGDAIENLTVTEVVAEYNQIGYSGTNASGEGTG